MHGGQRSTYPALPGIPNPPEDPQLYKDILNALGLIDQMAHSVGVEAPWNAKGTARLDHQNVSQWVKANLRSPLSLPIFDAASEALYGKDGSQLSVLFNAFYSAAARD